MNVGRYVDQNAYDLIFYLLPEIQTPLESLEQGNTEQDTISMEAHIIGASDKVKFTIGSFTFWEVCACVPLKERHIICQAAFENSSQGNINRLFGKFQYHFQWSIFEWEKGRDQLYRLENLYKTFREKIMKGVNGYIAIKHEFALKKGQTIIPETIVTVEVADHVATVNSIHTYPPVHIVHTNSTLSL